MRFRLRLSVLAAVVIALTAGAPTVAADGPWRGRILDGETGQPLAGALVVAVFYRLEGGWSGHSSWFYYDSSEVTTDADGRFEIPGRSFWSMIGKPMYTSFFKLGYCHSRGETSQAVLTSMAGAQIELSRAKTRDNQLSCLPLVPLDAPASHMPLTREARRATRKALGLSP